MKFWIKMLQIISRNTVSAYNNKFLSWHYLLRATIFNVHISNILLNTTTKYRNELHIQPQNSKFQPRQHQTQKKRLVNQSKENEHL